MPLFAMTKTYADNQVLNESDIDNIKNSTETFINVTKLDADNIQNLAITTALIATSAVTDVKLATDSVTNVKIKDLAVTLAKMAVDSVDSSKIVNGSIVGGDISGTAALSIASLTTTGDLTVGGNFQPTDIRIGGGSGPLLTEASAAVLNIANELRLESNSRLRSLDTTAIFEIGKSDGTDFRPVTTGAANYYIVRGKIKTNGSIETTESEGVTSAKVPATTGQYELTFSPIFRTGRAPAVVATVNVSGVPMIATVKNKTDTTTVIEVYKETVDVTDTGTFISTDVKFEPADLSGAETIEFIAIGQKV